MSALRSEETGSGNSESPHLYASLIGPLLGAYYPMPLEFNKAQCRAALNTSRLRNLWHSVYTRAEVAQQVSEYGGLVLDDAFAHKLDYDSHVVSEWAGVGA